MSIFNYFKNFKRERSDIQRELDLNHIRRSRSLSRADTCDQLPMATPVVNGRKRLEAV